MSLRHNSGQIRSVFLQLEQENNTWVANVINAYDFSSHAHMPKVYPTYAIDLVWHTHQLSADCAAAT